jgi:IclR family KDG regulon transcriptional repressor
MVIPYAQIRCYPALFYLDRPRRRAAGKFGRKSMSRLENATHQGLGRAFELIMLLVSTNVPMSIMEISRALGITRTTAYTMVNTLMAQHCLERNPVTKKYTVGYRFYEIGSLYRYQFPFLNTAEKHINVMFEKWHVRINVSVLKPEAASVILLSKDSSLLPRIPHGYVVFAHATASGKLLMAHQPAEIIDSWFKTVEFPQFMPNTISDKTRLYEEFALIRQRGFSIEIEELAMHRACVAAPIRDMTGETIAAVSFATSRQHLEQNRQALTDSILTLANDISGELGYNLLMVNRF